VSTEWVWDDESIPHDETILRRIKKHPDCLLPDLATGELGIKAGALIFDKGDGMSVHQDSLRHELGVLRQDMCDWETHHAIEFEADVVRDGDGGVVHKDDPDDPVLGEAHALVRTKSPTFPRTQRNAIRARIIDAYRWVPEDPFCPATTA
jgi:hypothetical protein